MATTCIAERSVCAIRATRLGADCAPLTGTSNGAVATAIATINVTADVQEGTKFEPVDGCGRIVYSAEDPDIIKRKNITLELVTQDFELIELMTDSEALIGDVGSLLAGEVIGVAEPGPSTPTGNGILLEIWTKTASGTGACGEAGGAGLPPYIRHRFGKVLLRPGDRTYENAHANVSFTGTANANPLAGDPWNDLPFVTTGGVGNSSPHLRFFDDTIPVSSCGYLTVA